MTMRLAAACLFLLSPVLAHAQTVLCFGDSLTAGYLAPQGDAYTDYMQKQLDSQGYHVQLINQGVDGNTTKDGLERMPSALATHPAIVILELGGNDGLRGEPVVGIKQNLATMIQQFQAAHIRVLLAGIIMPPNLGADYVKQFNAIYPALAAKYHVPLMPFFLQNVYTDDSLMNGDGIHPNAAGYEKVAENVEPYLKPMLKK